MRFGLVSWLPPSLSRLVPYPAPLSSFAGSSLDRNKRIRRWIPTQLLQVSSLLIFLSVMLAACISPAQCYRVARASFRAPALLSSGMRNRATRLSAMRSTSTGPPLEPKDFGLNFKVERYTTQLHLEQFNAHPMDSAVVYDEANHAYYINGKKMAQSVTGVVESCFEKFNPQAVAERMIQGSNWPRAGYMQQDGKTPLTLEDILKKWDSQGRYAANYGTWMHYNIERYLNNMEPSPSLKEMKLFMDFEKTFIQGANIKPTRTEWRIAAEDESIGGTVDFVGAKPDGTFVIMDWKTTKGLAGKMSNAYGRKAKPPLGHLDECEGNKYCLQLNIYKYILEKYYAIKISEMRLAAFNRSDSGYFTTIVPDMEQEVQKLLKHRGSVSTSE